MDATSQRPIHFGGVQLPPVPLHQRPGLADEVFQAIREHALKYEGSTPLDLVVEDMLPPLAHCNPPAGEATPEARLVNVSRMAVAAKIKHGVRLAEILPHLHTLAELEERLIEA